ncbi:hypothetical protein V6N13_053959 [Hibiscus sabdariffa]
MGLGSQKEQMASCLVCWCKKSWLQASRNVTAMNPQTVTTGLEVAWSMECRHLVVEPDSAGLEVAWSMECRHLVVQPDSADALKAINQGI